MSLEDIDKLTRKGIFECVIKGNRLYFETSDSQHNWNKNTIDKAIIRLLNNNSQSETKFRNLNILASASTKLK
jgi:hypothetical protein